MKDLAEITACVVDAGTFVPLAETMGRATAKTYYYSPHEQEYLGVERCVIGDGLKHCERIDDFMEPDIFDAIGLWIFPDIGYGGFQRFLAKQGKLVWGSMGASDLELYRTRFLKVLKDVGLPVVHSVTKKGLTELSEHLKTVKDKWVKINRYRDNMETWHHQDYQHSQRELERLAMEFGPLKEYIVFVVQDAINDEDDSPVAEIGYDGWSVDGQFPEASYQGYEKKNQLYLGSRLDLAKLPEAVRVVNEAMAPILAGYRYRNFWATEILIKGGIHNFIDPTPRMAGQTMEHLLRTCANLPQVIYEGAQGNLIKPEFSSQFALEATLHYTGGGDGGWKTFNLPEELEPWVKLYRYCYADGAYQFPPHKSDELGVITGNGDTVEEGMEELKAHFALLQDEPVSIELSGFADLLKQIEAAEAEGIEFTDQPLPGPEIVLQENGA